VQEGILPTKVRFHLWTQVLLLVTSGLLFVCHADIEEHDIEPRVLESAFSLGYRVVDTDKTASRVGEYSFLGTGTVADITLKDLTSFRRFRFDADYKDRSEYFAEMDFDYRGLFRINATSETFNHHLDHYPERADIYLPGNTSPFIQFTDYNPGDTYSLEVKRDRIKIRGRLPQYPAHINLGYWRMERVGSRQSSFLDEGGAQTTSCSQCHVQSRSTKVNNVIEELTAGVDSHLGGLDVNLSTLYREFRNEVDTPVDSFGLLEDTSVPLVYRNAGNYQHDSIPDSRHYAHTLSVHTSLSGGLVAGGMVSLGSMENRSRLLDVSPVRSKTDYWKAAGDLTLIPIKELTFNFRYRILDMDSDNPDQLQVTGLPSSPIDVRDSIDLVRATYSARASYRPDVRFTLQGEFEREEVERGNTGVPVDDLLDPVWELPAKENNNTYKLSAFLRPFGNQNLKLHAWYKYQTSDDPAYGASLKNGHQGFMSGTWNLPKNMGLTANLQVVREENNRSYLYLFDTAGTINRYSLARKLSSNTASTGFWWLPRENVTLNVRYGYQFSHTRQNLVYGVYPETLITEDNADFTQRVHTVQLGCNWRILDNVSTLAEARYTRSSSWFDPDFAAQDIDYYGLGTVLVDSSGIRELSELQIRQIGFKAGVEWTFNKDWSCSAQYSVDQYTDLDTHDYDGTVQNYMMAFTRKW